MASPLPGGFAGGTYAWTCTPSNLCSIVTGQNSSSVTLRTNEVGTFTANVAYTKNGLTAPGSVTINSVLPTLVEYTANQGSDRVNPPNTCNRQDVTSLFWWYELGCKGSEQEITLSSLIRAPTTFISDPTKSLIKYVQAVSAFRKYVNQGVRCDTKRTNEANVSSGWQLDTVDPMPGFFSVLSFSSVDTTGPDFRVEVTDSPGQALTSFVDWKFIDSIYIDDRFETYVVYFTGPNAGQPLIQRPLGKLAWNWGGQVVLDWNGNDAVHHRRFTNAPPTLRTGQIFAPSAQIMSSLVAMNGNVRDLPGAGTACPGGPPLTENRIDSSREFVKYHYKDFLGRDPSDPNNRRPEDPVGWNFWTSQISQCIFDLNCVHAMRVQTGLAFFYSGDFIATDPDLANPPGSPNFNPTVYNRAFVKWCYWKYLGRGPDLDGWDFWTNDLNSNGNYAHMIDAFQLCDDYRLHRTFQ